MRSGLVSGVIALVIGATVACAPPAAAPTTQPGAGGTGPAASKTLDMAVRYEVNDLLPKRTGGAAATYSKRAFNAMLALVDSQATARPYLAESLPQLNQDTWQVTPDGHMTTTYTLRPNLTWQDGKPLTADDFVFAYQVYSEKAMGGTFISSPQDQIEEITGKDARTLVIRWKALYPQAGTLAWQALDPLPRHILESSFATVQQDATNLEKFLALPFWTTEYIGAGPFKLNKWEPGTSLDGSAFDGHALGRPKIDHVVIHFIPDENTVLTNVLSGAIQLAGDTSI
ncbi:MAG TPA: ABC transporter substrate-binding protein, partial [Chloroflexota bacterium]